MPTAVPVRIRTKKQPSEIVPTLIAKKVVRRKKSAAVVIHEPKHISSGAGMTAGLELWTSTTGQIELRDTTADNRFATDVSAWSSLNAAAIKKSKDAEK